ncbi:DUF445 family protein [Gracilibacillus caseinilyticus]|uniref:DUF445 family protein n=1 Tax=Gracilibacillus caseinilyticus TaxID=2932256 RepID=A0ABY4EQS9_9BACI|nr:DUF445 family protein [Gracilibacillus caseinilyticus]UOQ46792.1 DUF445 family protein [Gracilibacillus caseinilyticus]
MDEIITIVVMVVIGAFIGGLTNSIAIKMLFRPYEAKYIGKWKVPFTPGVIPKRRDQLAKQLGELVVKHLLTRESIELKLTDPALKQQVQRKLEKEWELFLEKEHSVHQLAERFKLPVESHQVQTAIADKVVQQLDQFLQENKQLQLKNWLESAISEQDVDAAAQLLRIKAIELLNKEETQEKMESIIKQYAASKGFLGNMVLSMFSSDELAIKILRLVTEYLQSQDGVQWLNHAVSKEWEAWLDKELQIIEPFFKKADTQHLIKAMIIDNIPADDWLDHPVQVYLTPFSDQIKEKVLPVLVEQLFVKLAESVPSMLAQLGIEKMVEQQVTSFPTSRLEEIILSISRKEFKLITYLGALLGGFIGLFQAILFIVV